MTHGTRGTTLIELLVVISVCSVVMCTTGVVFHVIYGAEKEGRRASEHAAAAARLALQFRRDAHAADQARLLTAADAKPAGLAFSGPGAGSIEFRWQDAKVVRVAKQGEQTVHQDAFGLPSGTAVQWQLESSPSQTPVAVVRFSRAVARGVKLEPIPGHRIEAAVGLLNEGGTGP